MLPSQSYKLLSKFRKSPQALKRPLSSREKDLRTAGYIRPDFTTPYTGAGYLFAITHDGEAALEEFEQYHHQQHRVERAIQNAIPSNQPNFVLCFFKNFLNKFIIPIVVGTVASVIAAVIIFYFGFQ